MPAAKAQAAYYTPLLSPEPMLDHECMRTCAFHKEVSAVINACVQGLANGSGSAAERKCLKYRTK